MSPTIAAPPVNDSLIELDPLVPSRRDPFFIAKSWLLYLQDALAARVQQAPAILTSVALTNQSASIGATPIPLRSVSAGLYRVSYYLRITTAAAVSSSATVTLTWTESGVALTLSGAALTTNTTASVQTGTFLIQSDANAPISYAVTYASNVANTMAFRLSITCEAVS